MCLIQPKCFDILSFHNLIIFHAKFTKSVLETTFSNMWIHLCNIQSTSYNLKIFIQSFKFGDNGPKMYFSALNSALSFLIHCFLHVYNQAENLATCS